MSLDFDKLAKQVDEALAKETKETLINFLNKDKNRIIQETMKDTKVEQVREVLRINTENVSVNKWIPAIHEDKHDMLSEHIVSLLFDSEETNNALQMCYDYINKQPYSDEKILLLDKLETYGCL